MFELNRKTLFVVGGVLVGLVLLLGMVHWQHRPHHFGRIEVSPFENDMIESLVRGILQEKDMHDAGVCFLSFGEGRTAPSKDFLKRFADCRSPTVCGTDGSVSPTDNRFYQKDNGRPGVIIQIIDFHPFIATVFDITVSFSNLPSGHNRVVYRLSDVGGTWLIKSAQRN